VLKTEASLEGFLACWNLLEIQGIIAPVPTSIWRDNVVGKWIFHVPSFQRQDLPLDLRLPWHVEYPSWSIQISTLNRRLSWTWSPKQSCLVLQLTRAQALEVHPSRLIQGGKSMYLKHLTTGSTWDGEFLGRKEWMTKMMSSQWIFNKF